MSHGTSRPCWDTQRKWDGSLEAKIGKRIKPQPDGCWLFAGKRDAYGQIAVRVDGVAYKFVAHRWVYETIVGEIPEGHVLHHTCLNKGCVNPAHLMPLTQGEHAALHAELNQVRVTASHLRGWCYVVPDQTATDP